MFFFPQRSVSDTQRFTEYTFLTLVFLIIDVIIVQLEYFISDEVT